MAAHASQSQVPLIRPFLLIVFVAVALLTPLQLPAASAVWVWVDTADGTKECIQWCIRQDAGNCYHASWTAPSYDDKCSKEATKAKCEDNDNGVWCGGQGPPPSPSPGPTGQGISIRSVTFYGYPDNCPPSAQPHSLGTGTYDEPITFAAAPSAIQNGTMMYIPRYKKYFIMDDECQECEDDWRRNKIYHVDLWLGPDHMARSYTRLVPCENELSEPGETSATLDPPRNLPVDQTPFYDAKKDECMNHNAEPCYEMCDPKVECNECNGQSGSCEEVARKFSLSLECFKKLNPKIKCEVGVRWNDTFCQGSGCPLL